MVKHIVMFRFQGSSEQWLPSAEAFRTALLALPEQIAPLQAMEVGININPAEQWHLVLTATLPTLADVDLYAKHPAHVAAAGLIAQVKDARACVDYEI